MTPEVAAAISMALEKEYGGEVYAAIAVALNDYLNERSTTRKVSRSHKTRRSAWADKSTHSGGYHKLLIYNKLTYNERVTSSKSMATSTMLH